MSVLTACTPRTEVLEGELDDAIFAASLVDLVGGTAKPVYGDARTFFANTHPASQLRDTARRVFLHLTDASQGGAFIRLSTGFGGGKTHALMTLWHLAKNSGDPTIGAEIVDPAARPPAVTVVAIDVGAAGAPNFAQHGSVTTHSLWGEVAYQLAGETGLQALGEGEALDRQPNLDEFRALFPEGPVLILMDELVMYMAGLREGEQKGLLNFINKLIGICTSRPLTALVISDPATQAVYAAHTQALAKAMAAQDADQITGRRATDIDPIGDESSAVIVRRLFANVDQNVATNTAQSYHSLYDRLIQDPAGRLVPDEAARDEYTARILRNYPFHPSLMRTIRDRLNTIPEFNSSRGTLRLFARLVRNVYDRKQELSLITAGEVDWADPAIVNELLQRLNREAFGGAVNTDIRDHAAELDAGEKRGVHTRVASALLLESLTQDPNAGFAPQELTLAVIRPEEAGSEAVDAMERLASQCWYTYRLDSGVGHQFRVEPNVNQMIAKRAPQVLEADALGRVHTDVQGYFAGPVFKVVAFPANARQVQDSAKLQLALCDSIDLARRVASLANDEDPAAEQPRQFRNAIVALAPSTDLHIQAISVARRLKAAEEIQAENQGESGKRIREQLSPILNDLRRQLSIQSRRAFSNVVLADGQVRPIEEKYLVAPDEKVLSGNTGQANLRDFLEQKMLIYRSSDRLDTDLYIQQVLTGSTPSVQNPGAYSGRSLHERLLSRPGMRLVPEEAITRRSIVAGVEAGRLVVRLADGSAYDATGAVVGVGQRERKAGNQLPPGFPLDDATLVTLSGEPVAEPWFEVTEPAPGPDGPDVKPPPPPPPPSATKTSSWAQAQEWASTRNLKTLTLAANSPSGAMTLVPLAGPLGANTLKLSVLCTGTGKNNGGTFAFRAENTSVTHPTQPLNTASTIYNSLEEGGRQFTVRLMLDFGAGRAGMETQLEQTAKAAAEGVTMEAEFAAGTTTQGSFA